MEWIFAFTKLNFHTVQTGSVWNSAST